jgi:predicted RNase H-like HicB family nuclease
MMPKRPTPSADNPETHAQAIIPGTGTVAVTAGVVIAAPTFTIETEREEDGRWIAEVTALSGAQAYGATEAEARSKAAALALRVIADRIEHGEPVPDEARDLFALT